MNTYCYETNTEIEYLHTSDTELDEDKAKCGEIFVSFTSYDCVLFCILCCSPTKYLEFKDFVNHIRAEHLNDEREVQQFDPYHSSASLVELLEENEESSSNAPPEEEMDCSHLDSSEGMLKHLEISNCLAEPSVNSHLDDCSTALVFSAEDPSDKNRKCTKQQNVLSLKSWPDDIILQFIELYHEQECLWNVKCREYHNHVIKANAYKQIIDKFGKKMDRTSVKHVIRLLRQYFFSVDKKNKSSDPLGTSIKTLTPNELEIYERLSFLQNMHTTRRRALKIDINTCKTCSHIIPQKDNLNLEIHSQDADIITPCKNSLTLDSQSVIEIQHKTNTRSNERMYNCPICKLNFKDSDELATHLNDHIPTNLQKHICEFCGSKFDDRSNLLIHIRRHTDTKKHVCNVCHKRFVTSTELKSHIVVHSNEKPFVCETCGLRFKYSNRLNTHRLFHREPKFECTDCKIKFVTKRRLIDHQRIHAPKDAPVEKLHCAICGNLFRNRDSLSRHVRKIHKIKKRENRGNINNFLL